MFPCPCFPFSPFALNKKRTEKKKRKKKGIADMMFVEVEVNKLLSIFQS